MFTVMFNNTKRKKYAAYLLSLILNQDFDYVFNNVEFMNTRLDRENYYDKGTTVDLVCELDKKVYCIELNNNQDISRLERNMFYAGQLYGQKARRSGPYQYNYVYLVNINNFNFVGNKKIIDIYKPRNEEGKVLTEKLTYVHIFLPLIRKKYYNNDNELNELEKFLLIINEKETKEIKEIIKERRIMEEYRDEAFMASQDTEILGLYNKEIDEKRIRENDMAIKTGKAYDKGEKVGYDKDEKIGIEKIVINMLNDNEPIEKIIKYSNLSKNEILKIKESL